MSLKKNENRSPGINNVPQGAELSPIICIGITNKNYTAIAGLLAQFNTLSGNWVIILVPGDEKDYSEYLAANTRISICRFNDGETIPGHKIIVIPTGKYIAFKRGKLLAAKTTAAKKNISVTDFLLQSVASEKKQRCVGILFNNDDNNDPAGIRAIKTAGGLVLVQQPDGTYLSNLNNNTTSPNIEPGMVVTTIQDFIFQQQQSTNNIHPPLLNEPLGQQIEDPLIMDEGQPGSMQEALKKMSGQLAALAVELNNKKNELSKAAQQLQINHQKYRSVFENPKQAIILIDATGRILEANKAACSLFGYPENVLLTLQFEKLAVISNPVFTRDAENNTRAGNVSGELTGVTCKGETLFCEYTCTVFTQTDGTSVASMMITGTGERKKQDAAGNGALQNPPFEEPGQPAEYFKGAFDHSAIGMMLLDLAGNWKEVNDSACNIVGYSRDELLQHGFRQITYPGDPETGQEFLEELIQGKRQFYQVEKRFLHQSGNITWCMLVVSAVKDKTGKTIHFIAQLEDINERKIAEQDLQRREQQYKALFEQNSAAVFSVDLIGNITSANQVLASKAETTVEQVQKMHFRDFVNPADLALTTEAFENVKTGKAQEIRIRVYTLNGNELSIVLILLPVIVNNSITGVYAIAHDITADQQAQQVLEKAISDLNKIMDASLDVICTIDLSGRFVQVSAAAERVFGFTPAELTGINCLDLIYKEDLAATRQVILEMSNGIVKNNFENRYLCKDGRMVTIEWSGRYDKGDQLIHCIARDATAMKKAVSENNRLADTLQRSLNEIYIFDAHSFLVEYANEGALKNTGYTLTQITQQTFPGLNQCADINGFQLLVAPLVQKTKDKIIYETIHNRFNGSSYHAAVHLQKSEYNNKPVFLAFVQDISEQKIAEQEKEFERSNKEALINSTNDLIWSIDTSYKLITANNAFLETFEALTGQVIKTGDLILDSEGLDAATRAHWQYLYQRALSGEPFNMEIMVPANGNTKQTWRATYFNSIRNGDQVIGAAIYSRDITENKLNLQRLQESEQRFRSLIENSADMLILINANGIMEYISPAVERVYGYSNNETRPMDAMEIIHPGDVEIAHSFLQQSFQQPGIPIPILFRNQKKDGNYIWVEGTITNMLNTAGVNAIVANFRDITSRKEIEDALYASEEKYKLLFYSNPLPVWIYDIATMEILDVNEPAIHQYGFSRSEFLSGAHREIINPETIADLTSSQRKTIVVSDVIHLGTTPHRKKNREIIQVEMFGQRIPYNDRNCMMVVCNDITLKHTAENALQLSNERYRYVTSATSDAIWDWDLQKDTIYWGEGFQSLFGYEIDNPDTDIINWKKLVHPEDTERVMKGITAIITGTAINWTDEYRFLKANGEYAYVTDKGLVVRDENGKGTRMIGAMQDITRKKREEQQLKLFESVITNTNDGVLITAAEPLDEPGPAIVYVNEAFTKMTGYSKEEITGKTPRILQGPKSDRKALARLRRSMDKRENCEIETINYKKNGEAFWVNFSIVPMTDHKGQFTHWIAITRDISLRKRQEAEKEIFFKLVQALGKQDLLAAWTNILRTIGNFTGLEYGEAWMVNFDQSDLLLQKSWTKNPMIAKRISTDRLIKIKKSEGLTGDAWNKREVTLVNDITNNNAYLSKKFAGDCGLNSAVFIPVTFNGQNIALLSFYSHHPEIDAAGFKSLFDTISQQLGPYVQSKKAEDELARFFNLSPDFLAIAGADGYFKKINPAFTRILGYSEQELFSRPISDFTHPDDRALTDTKRNGLIKGEALLNFENRYLTRNGETRWFAWTSTPLPEEGLIFAVAKDITEKKKLDEERKRILESISDFFFALDKQLNFTYLNSATEKLFTNEPGALLGENIWEAWPSLREGIFIDTMQHSIQTKEPVSFEFYDLSRDNWFEGNFYPSDEGLSVFFRSFSDRKIAEQALQEAFKEKDTILESIGDAFFAVDKNWTVTYWNKMAEQILNTRRENIVGQNLWQVFEDAVPLSYYHNYKRAIVNNEAVHFEEYYPPLGIWFDISAYPSHDGLSVYFKDISVRKEAEDAIRTSNERYDMVAKATNDAIWDWDLITNQVTRPGKRLETLLGYEGREAHEVDEFWSTHVHPEDWARLTESRNALFNNPDEKYWEDEYRFLAINGTYAYVYDKGYIIRNQEGKAIRMIGASQDITKEKKQVNEIMRIRQNLDSLINTTSDLIWSINTDLHIIAANNAYLQMIEAITGAVLKEGDPVVYPSSKSNMQQDCHHLYQRALSGESFYIEETFYKPGTADILHTLISFSPIVNKDGKISGVACFAKDVTELKQAGEKLKELNNSLEKRAEELANSNSELERFAYVASHDLQEPLRMVSSFLQLLEKKYGTHLDDTAKKYIHFSVDGADRMKRLINDLLQYSRAGTASLEIVPVNMNEVLEEVLLLFKNEVHTIDAEITVENLPVIQAGKSAMTQLMQNLIGNALKYRSIAKPVVTISAREEEGAWVFTVQDNGIGIDEKFKEKIFIIFQRLHNKDEFDGTGIGLAICKKITERYQGKIWVESEFGKGSRFIFAIPIR